MSTLEDMTHKELGQEIERLHDSIEEIEERDGYRDLDASHQVTIDWFHRAILLRGLKTKEFEIIRGRNTRNKLTITPNRVSVKLRIGIESEEEKMILKYSDLIVNLMGDVTHSMRGTFEDRRIRMFNNSGKIQRSFVLADLF